MKKILLLLLFIITFTFVGCSNNEQYDVVVTSFPCYDAVRAVTRGTDYKIKMLLKPGSDIHTYQPSLNDKMAIQKSKLFVYVGGESDSEWVEADILSNNKNKDLKIINMFDVLENKLILEAGEEDEYDEHVWLDPTNFMLVINYIKDTLKEIDNDNATKFENNAKGFISQLDVLDNNANIFFNDANITKIVVADKNPFIYFAKHYNIEVIGALSGCSATSETSFDKVIELKNIVEETKLTTIFKLELSNGKIADDVKKEVDNDIKNNKYNGKSPVVKELNSMQKISEEDFKSGITYLSLFSYNIEVIRRVLE